MTVNSNQLSKEYHRIVPCDMCLILQVLWGCCTAYVLFNENPDLGHWFLCTTVQTWDFISARVHSNSPRKAHKLQEIKINKNVTWNTNQNSSSHDSQNDSWQMWTPGADWPLGAPMATNGQAADLARCPVFFFYYYYFFFFFFFCLPNVPKWLVAFPNKSINYKPVSLDWQRRASRLFLASIKRFWTESMRGTRGRRGNGQKKQLNVAKLLTCSGLQVQVSFICNTL